MSNALGVYIFAGGFTLGMRKHFNVLAHFEDGPFGVATVKRNMPEIPIHTHLDSWPAAQYRGIVDVIYGNPPCAPWSTAGNIINQKSVLATHGIDAKWEIDPRVDCVRHQFALLEKIAPKVWIWESVAAAYKRGAPFIKQLVEQAIAQGYAVTLLRLNGAFCGLAQHRRRFFFVAHRVEIPWGRPALSPRTVADMIRGVASPEHAARASVGKNLKVMIAGMKRGQGGQHRFHEYCQEQDIEQQLNKNGHVKNRPGFLTKRLAWDATSGTIVSGSCLVHPDEDRMLTVHETKLLSGYPADYEFIGTDAYGQISKAVLPPVADWLGGLVAAGITAGAPTPATLRDVNYLK